MTENKLSLYEKIGKKKVLFVCFSFVMKYIYSSLYFYFVCMNEWEIFIDVAITIPKSKNYKSIICCCQRKTQRHGLLSHINWSAFDLLNFLFWIFILFVCLLLVCFVFISIYLSRIVCDILENFVSLFSTLIPYISPKRFKVRA